MKALVISLAILAIAGTAVPGGQDTMDAGNFLVGLLHEGNLPGVSTVATAGIAGCGSQESNDLPKAV